LSWPLSSKFLFSEMAPSMIDLGQQACHFVKNKADWQPAMYCQEFSISSQAGRRAVVNTFG